MRIAALLMTLTVVLAVATPAKAVNPRRVGTFNKQAAVGAYGRAVYPKYYWGLHAREMQNIGVPHGDIGILGSGLSRDPW
jgi:hypothetical protein